MKLCKHPEPSCVWLPLSTECDLLGSDLWQRVCSKDSWDLIKREHEDNTFQFSVRHSAAWWDNRYWCVEYRRMFSLKWLYWSWCNMNLNNPPSAHVYKLHMGQRYKEQSWGSCARICTLHRVCSSVWLSSPWAALCKSNHHNLQVLAACFNKAITCVRWEEIVCVREREKAEVGIKYLMLFPLSLEMTIWHT